MIESLFSRLCCRVRPGGLILLLLATALITSIVVACPARASQGSNLAPAHDLPAHELKALIAQRLAIMPDVAAYKWLNDRAIEDLEREAQILDGLVAKAESQGLAADFAAAFFEAQFRASKMIQFDLFEQWRGGKSPPPAEAPDLASELRPRISGLTPALLQALAAYQPYLEVAEAYAVLAEAPEEWADAPEVWQAAIAPFGPVADQ